MMATVTDWRIDLIRAHHGLFHPPAGAPEAAQGDPDCGDGWRDLLEHTLLKTEAALADGGTFTALRIKEKFETLRFYWNGRLSHKAKAKVQPVVVNPGLGNLHLMQGIGQRGARVSCRRYDRATDTFIDVSPNSLKIEE